MGWKYSNSMDKIFSTNPTASRWAILQISITFALFLVAFSASLFAMALAIGVGPMMEQIPEIIQIILFLIFLGWSVIVFGFGFIIALGVVVLGIFWILKGPKDHMPDKIDEIYKKLIVGEQIIGVDNDTKEATTKENKATEKNSGKTKGN